MNSTELQSLLQTKMVELQTSELSPVQNIVLFVFMCIAVVSLVLFRSKGKYTTKWGLVELLACGFIAGCAAGGTWPTYSGWICVGGVVLIFMLNDAEYRTLKKQKEDNKTAKPERD